MISVARRAAFMQLVSVGISAFERAFASSIDISEYYHYYNTFG